MADTIFIGVLLVVILILSIIAMTYRRQAKQIQDQYFKLYGVYTEATTVAETGQSTATEYLNCCRLIAIHRNGRMNTFTFVRRNASFMIQTMGLMSDVPDDWRKQAGLDQ